MGSAFGYELGGFLFGVVTFIVGAVLENKFKLVDKVKGLMGK